MTWNVETITATITAVVTAIGAAIIKLRKDQNTQCGPVEEPYVNERENTGRIVHNWTQCEEKLRDAHTKIDEQNKAILRNDSYIKELKIENMDLKIEIGTMRGQIDFLLERVDQWLG